MSENKVINAINQPEILKIFKKNNISHLYLFWSYAKNKAKKNSDIDILFEVKPWVIFTLLNIWDIKYNLENIFKKEVDLVDKRAIKKELKDYIEKDLIKIF